MRRILLGLFSLSLLAVPSAFAQSDETEDEETPANVRYKKETEIIFGGTTVGGSVEGPWGHIEHGLPERQKKALIDLKPDFNREMRASVDAVR